MIPAGLLAGKAALMANERESVDFPMEMTAATFCYFFLFFSPAVTASQIAATQNPSNATILLDNPPATAQKPVTSGSVLERGFRDQIWESRGVGGGCSAAWGKKSPRSNSTAIHQQFELGR